MIKQYHLEVIETEGKLPAIRIIFDHTDQYSINTFSDISEPMDIGAMQKWCIENENGWRTSYDTFKFRNKEQLTMFILRWT
jgi:hypothetical protein